MSRTLALTLVYRCLGALGLLLTLCVGEGSMPGVFVLPLSGVALMWFSAKKLDLLARWELIA